MCTVTLPPETPRTLRQISLVTPAIQLVVNDTIVSRAKESVGSKGHGLCGDGLTTDHVGIVEIKVVVAHGSPGAFVVDLNTPHEVVWTPYDAHISIRCLKDSNMSKYVKAYLPAFENTN